MVSMELRSKIKKIVECDSLILSGDAEPGKSRSLIFIFGEHGVKIQNKDIADF